MAGKLRFFSITLRHFFAALIVACYMFTAITQGEAKESQKDAMRELAESNDSEAGLNHVILQLPWLNQFQFAGYYVAVEKGFYRDAGFKVTIVEGNPKRRPVEEVISGRANYGVAKAELLLHHLHGKPVLALAAIFQHSAIILLAKKESGIDNPHEMIGRRVMLLEGDDAAEYIAMFQNEGVSLEQIKVIPSTFNINDLIDGKTDVFNAYTTNEPYYLERKGIPVSIISPKAYGIDFYGDCLFTSEQEIKGHPDQVRAFRAASLRGWEYAMAHSEEIIDLILTKYGVKKTRDHLRFEANAIRKLMLPDLVEIGHMNPGRWRHMADTYVELGMVDSGYSLKDFIYNPNPTPDYTWVRRIVGVTVSISVLISLGFFVLLFFNRKLQVEVTQRRQAEEALKESEERLKSFYHATFEGIAIYEQGKMIDFNRQFADIFGYEHDELTGREVMELVAEEDRELVLNNIRSGFDKPYELKALKKDGTVIFIEVHGQQIQFQGRPARVTAVHDLTERKRAEEERQILEAQLQQAQKMETIATLAGGVAHEFNNALYTITGNIELLDEDYLEDEGIRNYTDPMKASTQRMARLSNQLLAYARGGKYQSKIISSNDLVEDLLPVIKHIIPSLICVETDLPQSVFNIEVDLTQMQMVLSAIVINSVEAIKDKGRIRIIVTNEDLDEEFVKHHAGLKPGPHVCFTVEDNGKGMDKKTREIIFEPFFTTKFQGRGLGMAAAYGIVKNHNGWISVYSELGEGTVVRIYLPAIEVQIEEAKESKSELIKGAGTILLIEDEELVMDVSLAMLERLGYSVLVARTGIEGIDIAKVFDGDIDLAILDIGLPDMQGDRVYTHLMKNRPNLKVLVCSGYSIDGPAQEIMDGGAQGFIQKPFSLERLSVKLKEVLKEK